MSSREQTEGPTDPSGWPPPLPPPPPGSVPQGLPTPQPLPPPPPYGYPLPSTPPTHTTYGDAPVAGARRGLSRTTITTLAFATLVLGLVGTVFLLVSAAMQQTMTVETDSTTTGTVTRIHGSAGDNFSDSDGQSSGSCSATATFEVDGTTYESRSAVSSSGLCRMQTGDEIEVRYLADDPRRNEIGFSSSTFFGIFKVTGGALIGAVILLWVIAIVRSRRPLNPLSPHQR